jgi:mRNA-degrading endonuclease RelE of RelBE toxin-antitoxin system
MTGSVRQTRRFSRQYKKLYDSIAADVDSAVDGVAQNPEIGERKKGDLAALRVYTFRTEGQSDLLGYTLDEDIRLVYLEAVGSHENFYRDLKR